MIGTAQHRLARITAVGCSYIIRSQEPAATASSQRIGIIITIGLAVVARRPSRTPRVDGESCPRISDVVVREHGSRTQRRRDVIGTTEHRLAWYTAVICRYVICRQKPAATATGQRIGIIITIGLTAGIRRPR